MEKEKIKKGRGVTIIMSAGIKAKSKDLGSNEEKILEVELTNGQRKN